MKVSVSLPDEDVEFLDSYAHTHQIASRSATLHRAIRLLRASELAQDYAEAFAQWDDEDSQIWDAVVADGLTQR